MAQLATAQFIKDDGFATGLTPTVTITEALTGTVRGTFDMEEVSPGNYKYNYVDGSDQMLFFFNYDAGDDDVINRYQGNNNKIEVSRGGGGGITTIKNNVINREQMDKIAELVIEKLPKQEVFDSKNIEKKLVLIEDKINESNNEFDYDTILSSNEEVIKTIKDIKFPAFPKIPKPIKQDDKKILKAIKGIETRLDKIEKEDIKEMKEYTKKIKTKKEQKREDMLEKLMKEINDKGTEVEIENLIEAPYKEVDSFISLLEKDG